jgi:hypothetical protein
VCAGVCPITIKDSPCTSANGRGGRKHHPSYASRTTRIARTDHLIDQIVYRLYGFTGEEIAIVEGRA